MSNNLQKLREKIDKIDKKLLKILAERFKITQKVGEYKDKHNLPITNKKKRNRDIRKLGTAFKKIKD